MRSLCTIQRITEIVESHHTWQFTTIGGIGLHEVQNVWPAGQTVRAGPELQSYENLWWTFFYSGMLRQRKKVGRIKLIPHPKKFVYSFLKAWSVFKNLLPLFLRIPFPQRPAWGSALPALQQHVPPRSPSERPVLPSRKSPALAGSQEGLRYVGASEMTDCLAEVSPINRILGCRVQ